MEILLVLFGLRPDSGRDALKSGSTAPAFQRKFCPSCPLFPRFSLSCPVTIWVFEIPRDAGPRWWSGILCRAQGRARLPGCWQSFKELKCYRNYCFKFLFRNPHSAFRIYFLGLIFSRTHFTASSIGVPGLKMAFTPHPFI